MQQNQRCHLCHPTKPFSLSKLAACIANTATPQTYQWDIQVAASSWP